jgi:hypothetical protein
MPPLHHECLTFLCYLQLPGLHIAYAPFRTTTLIQRPMPGPPVHLPFHKPLLMIAGFARSKLLRGAFIAWLLSKAIFAPVAVATPPTAPTSHWTACDRIPFSRPAPALTLVRPLLLKSYGCPAVSSFWLPAQQSASDPGKPGPVASANDHRFWDRQNALLFSAVGASRTLDYFSTLNFRRRGRDEIFLNNETVDNHAAFAAIEFGATAVSVGVSYLFHRYHHHRLERWTSIIHAGAATTGDIRNYCLKTAHPSTTP